MGSPWAPCLCWYAELAVERNTVLGQGGSGAGEVLIAFRVGQKYSRLQELSKVSEDLYL